MVHMRFVALALCALGASYFVNPSIAFRQGLFQEINDTMFIGTGVDSLSREGRSELLALADIKGATWKDGGSTSAKAPHQQPSISSNAVGLWVYVFLVRDGVSTITPEQKTELVSANLPAWLNWLPASVVGWVAEKIPTSLFAQKLSEELKPGIEKALIESGIGCSFILGEVTGDMVPLFIGIDNVDQARFEQKNLGMLRSGVIDTLIPTEDDKESLADILADSGVPDAEVHIDKDEADETAFKIVIAARKKKVLKQGVPKAIGEMMEKHHMSRLARAPRVPLLTAAVKKAATAAARKLGVEDTHSASIAAAMKVQVQKQMTDQLLENGINAQIEALIGEDNGQKKAAAKGEKEHKIVSIDIHVKVIGVEPVKFVKAQRGVLRNAVVEQLANYGPGGLQFELQIKHNVGTYVAVEKCGWTQKDPPPDACSKCTACK